MAQAQKLSRQSLFLESFSLGHQVGRRFLSVWHFHPEVELVFIESGSGTKFIGDSISSFSRGQLVLIGANTPHLWLSDDPEQEDEDFNSASFSLHFDEQCFGKGFFQLPELKEIKILLDLAKLGLEIQDNAVKYEVAQQMKIMSQLSPADRLISFIQVLVRLSRAKNSKSLSSKSFVENYPQQSNTRLEKIHAYILNNFKAQLTLSHVAELANMTTSSVSRYIKQVTGQSFVEFLNEVRIGFACRQLLLSPGRNISEVCFDSGFNNISNFNKQFKRVTGCSPSDYLKQHEGRRADQKFRQQNVSPHATA